MVATCFPSHCRNAIQGMAATSVACHGARKLVESSELMGKISSLATNRLFATAKKGELMECKDLRVVFNCINWIQLSNIIPVEES